MVLLAHISDLHLGSGPEAGERAARVVDYLKALPKPIDALLVTGDIADHGAPEEYAQASRLFQAPFPVLTCPGNHDARPAYRECLLGEPAADGPVNRVHRIAGAAIFTCDSTVPGRSGGALEPETLAWLDTHLGAVGRDTPALLAFHHPPTALHHPLPDGSRLHPADPLAELIADHPHVVALLTGHAHTAAATSFAGRPLRAAPGVVWSLRLPWEGEEIADRAQPPGLAFHVIDGDRRLTTHYRFLP
jgi:3',5'-cyclic-AMP phosphodiesterase